MSASYLISVVFIMAAAVAGMKIAKVNANKRKREGERERKKERERERGERTKCAIFQRITDKTAGKMA